MGEQEERSIAFVREASRGIPGSIKDIADFLLSEGTGIADMTMRQIAARAYTSKPTLVRFAHQAGYAGWMDFRHDFLVAMEQHEAEQAQRTSVDVNRPFGELASTVDVVAGITGIQGLAAVEVERALDTRALAGAADAVLAAKTVAFFGVMQNYQRGKIFASNLGLMGVLCHVPHAAEAAAVAHCLQPGDCVVVASYSGNLTQMPMAFVPSLKERGVRVVAVTNSERSALGALADYALTYAPLEHYHAKIGPFYSGACTQLLLDILFAACYAQQYGASKDIRDGVLEDLRGIITEDF